MVLVMEKKVIRTTIVIDSKRREKIREYQAHNDIPIKKIVEMALDNFFIKENPGKNGNRMTLGQQNPYYTAISTELESCLAPKTAKTLLAEKCKMHNMSIESMSSYTISPEFISDLCRSISPMANNTELKKMEKQLLGIIGRV